MIAPYDLEGKPVHLKRKWTGIYGETWLLKLLFFCPTIQGIYLYFSMKSYECD